MATISTEKIYLKNGTQFNKVVKYSKGEFYIELPAPLCSDLFLVELRDKKVRGKSESEVNSLFSAKLTEWNNAKTTVSKVIIFEAKFQGALAKRSWEHKWKDGYEPSYPQSGISSSPDIWEFHQNGLYHDSKSLGMTMQWGVYNKEVSFEDKKKYTFVSGRPFTDHSLDRGNIRGYTEIEYTEEREQFFLSLDQAFAKMIAKVYNGLGDLTPEKLSLLADSQIKLLNN